MRIPEARDGSRFTADLVLPDGTYRVGAKGKERNVAGYADAVEALTTMDVPRWRRPNGTSGMAGIVTGVRWVEVAV
jgi:hypothetical protein